jgi:hypothetical protein
MPDRKSNDSSGSRMIPIRSIIWSPLHASAHQWQRGRHRRACGISAVDSRRCRCERNDAAEMQQRPMPMPCDARRSCYETQLRNVVAQPPVRARNATSPGICMQNLPLSASDPLVSPHRVLPLPTAKAVRGLAAANTGPWRLQLVG